MCSIENKFMENGFGGIIFWGKWGLNKYLKGAVAELSKALLRKELMNINEYHEDPSFPPVLKICSKNLDCNAEWICKKNFEAELINQEIQCKTRLPGFDELAV